MGYEDAKRDIIEIIKDRRGLTTYLPRCRICGHAVLSWGYQSGKVYACKACRRNRRNVIS